VLRWLMILCAACSLAACGGGSTTSQGGGTTAPGNTGGSSNPAIVNYATVTFDNGPTELSTDGTPYSAFNEPYVSVKICAPGSTTNCQTIDHIILDTGSVGLRIIGAAVNPTLLSALPTERSQSGNAVGECYKYVNSYAFGSVRQADFSIGDEQVSSMPLQVIGDTGAFASVPDSCSSGGGTSITSVYGFGAKGIIGVGTTTTDCGAICQSGLASGASYYDCPDSGCTTVIARAAADAAPFQQLPNPVAAFAIDNNGTILDFPTVAPAGVTTLTGKVYFGIGTRSNNTLSAGKVLPITTSSSNLGPGFLTATYKGKALTQSFLDSGSNLYYFIDSSLPQCTTKGLEAFYCPTAATALSPQLTATDGTTASGAFTLYNPTVTTAGSSAVAPGLGVNPTLVTPPLPFQNSFDFGVPFFFGHKVYTAIEGRAAGSVRGPFYAF
jgi:hypothetical protein